MKSTMPAAATLAASTIPGRKLKIVLYAATAFLYWVALYIYAPTLPTYVREKSQDLAMVGVVLSMYGLWQAIDRMPIGIAADWLGRRKPFIIGGLVLAGLGAWIMGRASGATELLVGRSVTGLAAGAWVPLVASFTALFPAADAVRASAIITVVSSVGRILGTSLTGTLNGAGGYSLAFMVAVAVAVAGIAIALPVSEPRRPSRRPSLAGFGKLLVRSDVIVPSLLAAIGQYANWAATFGFLPILARDLGVSDVQQSLLTSSSIVLVTIGNLAVAAGANRFGARRLLYITYALLFVGLGMASLATSLTHLVISQVTLGLSQGVGYPVLMGMSVQRVADNERTSAMGIFQAVYAIGMFAGPSLSGILASSMGIQPMFGLTAVVCVVVGVIGTTRLSEL